MEKEKKKINKQRIAQIITIITLIIFFIICTIHIPKTAKKVELTQLQANSHRQMMGYIIKTAEDKIVVIDGGTKEDAPNLLKYIHKLGDKVDVWFITHPHSDHAGAFLEIVQNENIKINKVYYTVNEITWYQQYATERAYEAEKFVETLKKPRIVDITEEVTLNQNIEIDNIKCEILGIKNPEIIEDAFNNSSMVIKMQLQNTSILFLGDTGEQSGDKLLHTQNDKLKADIVQVAHHGQAGAKETLYQAIQPKICLWPTPEWIWNNDNGEGENTGPWKTMETRKWMDNLGVKQHIIEKDGDTTISLE